MKPTNKQLSGPGRSTRNEQYSGEEPSSTELNEANDDDDYNLNRRLNIDDSADPLFGCKNSVVSHAENIRKIPRHQLNHINFHRQPSQLQRTNTAQHNISAIPLRRLPYQPHQKGYNI